MVDVRSRLPTHKHTNRRRGGSRKKGDAAIDSVASEHRFAEEVEGGTDLEEQRVAIDPRPTQGTRQTRRFSGLRQSRSPSDRGVPWYVRREALEPADQPPCDDHVASFGSGGGRHRCGADRGPSNLPAAAARLARHHLRCKTRIGTRHPRRTGIVGTQVSTHAAVRQTLPPGRATARRWRPATFT